MNSSIEELISADIAFSNLSVEKGAAYAFRQFLTENAIMLPQNKKPIHGIFDIFKSMNNPSSKEVLSWKSQGGKVSNSQDLGYTWGIYLLQLPGGKKIEGKYLNIWVKQTDGSWKVEVDMGNTNPQQKKQNDRFFN